MERVYTICLICGIVIPAITLILGSIGDIFEGLSDLINIGGIDFSLDLMGIDVYILPCSLQCLSAGSLVFGGVGKLVYNGHNLFITNVIAGISAYVVAVMFQTFISKLKKVENTACSKEQLLLYDAKVIHSILKGKYGSVSVTTCDGVTTEYPAKASDDQEVIKQGSIVKIIRFEKNSVIVEKKIEGKYDEK